mgnify:CR=1 FL=1
MIRAHVNENIFKHEAMTCSGPKCKQTQSSYYGSRKHAGYIVGITAQLKETLGENVKIALDTGIL